MKEGNKNYATTIVVWAVAFMAWRWYDLRLAILLYCLILAIRLNFRAEHLNLEDIWGYLVMIATFLLIGEFA